MRSLRKGRDKSPTMTANNEGRGSVTCAAQNDHWPRRPRIPTAPPRRPLPGGGPGTVLHPGTPLEADARRAPRRRCSHTPLFEGHRSALRRRDLGELAGADRSPLSEEATLRRVFHARIAREVAIFVPISYQFCGGSQLGGCAPGQLQSRARSVTLGRKPAQLSAARCLCVPQGFRGSDPAVQARAWNRRARSP